MMIVMSPQATPEQIRHVIELVEAEGFQVHRSDGQTQTVLGCVGTWPADFDPRTFEPENTVVELRGGLKVGGSDVVLMAGPCTIESREQVSAIAPLVRDAGAR